MNNNYLKVVYSNREKTEYPKNFAQYISNEHLYNTYGMHPKFLDIGAGDRTFTEEFLNAMPKLQIYGVDREGNNAICDFDKEKLPYEDGFFKFVFCKSVIEHVHNIDFFLSEIYRVLKKGGKVIILTPSWEYNYRWFYEDHTHVTPFTLMGLTNALKMVGFRTYVDYFYHLPLTWRNKYYKILCWLTRFLPDSWRWKTPEVHNIWIRFSKEVQLLGVARK